MGVSRHRGLLHFVHVLAGIDPVPENVVPRLVCVTDTLADHGAGGVGGGYFCRFARPQANG